MIATRTVVPAAVVAFCAMALTACSSDTTTASACSRDLTGGLTIAFGVHQNAPANDLANDPDIVCLVGQAVRNGNPISIVAVDGTPQAIARNVIVPVDDSDSDREARDIQAGVTAVLSTISGATADSDGSDTTAAIGLISDLAASSRTPDNQHTTVLVYDSMLPDSGLVNMTNPVWATAEPTDVADYLTSTGNLPDTTNTDWVLVGVGYAIAPQQALPEAQRQRVTDVWLEVLRRGGADTVEAKPLPQQGPGPDTEFTTGTVPIDTYPEPEQPCTSAPLVFDGNSAVRFHGESTELIDPAAASQALAGVGQWLAGNPARHASVVGTTANLGDLDGQRLLATRRAQTAVDLITAVPGVATGQLSAVGVGSDFPEYIPDADDPAARQANRSVRITLTGPSDC